MNPPPPIGPINSVPDDIPYGHNKAWCHNFYWRERSGKYEDSATVTWCTIAIIACAILLEILVQINFGGHEISKKPQDEEEEAASLLPEDSVSQQPQPQPAPLSPDTALPQGSSPNKTEPSDATTRTCCPVPTSPHTRATRLTLALILYAITLGTFITRIHSATHHASIIPDCESYITNPTPNWTWITFLAIIPFICATFAFLRALVDCALARWHSGLGYETKDDGCSWLPCLPFFGVLVLVYMLFEAVKIPVACIMGGWEMSIWTKEWTREFAKGTGPRGAEVEMRGEETTCLVGDVDGVGEEDGEGGDGLPRYDEIVGAGREYGDGRKGEQLV
ncbi:hypothetical protein EK21DRAFT_117930 [Setomelanomma holmii]|uniref:Uncharacterized protein n=1 Tax=Setomelanomma holmii TaxID=210430 RepID=A0A9P4GZG6_9PLEO|nr:hypothetical protein EK21DRAFT_117930 [Setomelanomma holmii]